MLPSISIIVPLHLVRAFCTLSLTLNSRLLVMTFPFSVYSEMYVLAAIHMPTTESAFVTVTDSLEGGTHPSTIPGVCSGAVLRDCVHLGVRHNAQENFQICRNPAIVKHITLRKSKESNLREIPCNFAHKKTTPWPGSSTRKSSPWTRIMPPRRIASSDLPE